MTSASAFIDSKSKLSRRSHCTIDTMLQHSQTARRSCQTPYSDRLATAINHLQWKALSDTQSDNLHCVSKKNKTLNSCP